MNKHGEEQKENGLPTCFERGSVVQEAGIKDRDK